MIDGLSMPHAFMWAKKLLASPIAGGWESEGNTLNLRFRAGCGTADRACALLACLLAWHGWLVGALGRRADGLPTACHCGYRTTHAAGRSRSIFIRPTYSCTTWATCIHSETLTDWRCHPQSVGGTHVGRNGRRRMTESTRTAGSRRMIVRKGSRASVKVTHTNAHSSCSAE